MIGKTLGHYQITGQLGKGGMGEVFQARDQVLGRDVAIKVLPAEFADDADRVARFQREAKVLASLNHPSIAAIYGLEESGGTNFLVLELVEGETLADRIKKSPIPVEESLKLALQIAEALEAAHEKGVIHRDLKPANIKVTPEGKVKVLDFGLAKACTGVREEMNLSNSPTLSDAATQQGVILGTAAYMSPEQAEAKAVDARSDVFSFGAVFYEMLSGRRAFHGESYLSTLSAILRGTPIPIRKLRSDVPAALERIANRCLEKNRQARYTSAAEIWKDLTAVQSKLAARRRGFGQILRRPRFAIPAFIVLVALAVAIGWFWVRSTRINWARTVALPEIARLADAQRPCAALWLVQQAEPYLRNDLELGNFRKALTARATFLTDPPGADIYVRDYVDVADSAEWTYLGRTPLQSVVAPSGYLAYRITKPDFDSIEGTINLMPFSPIFRAELKAKGSSPPGMIWVPAQQAGSTTIIQTGALRDLGLEGCWLDRYEVTNKQFKEFVDHGAYENKEYWKYSFMKGGRAISWEEAMAGFQDTTGRPGPATWEFGTYPKDQADYPVNGVSWYEAAAYAEFAGKSLPTVHHWASAAGDSFNSSIVQVSNFEGKGLARVGRFHGLSPYGSYDMAGNVKEWCLNPSGAYRYILGGAWNEPNYQFLAPDVRDPMDRSAVNGFRCAKYPTPPRKELTGSVKLFNRDRRGDRPVNDAIFQVYKAIHQYNHGDLKAAIESADDSSPYWRLEKVSFQAGYGSERVPCYLYLPKNAKPPYQTVVCFPGAEAIFAQNSQSQRTSVFDFIIRSGRALMYPIYKGTYERSSGVTFQAYGTHTNLWREIAIDCAKDLGRSLDYLETRQDIDREKLAYCGMSMGAAEGPRLMALEPRLKAGVLLFGGAYEREWPAEVDSFNYASRITVPILMLNGKYDVIFPLEGSQNPLFQALGTPVQNKKHFVVEGGHVFLNQEDIKESLAWLDRYLGSVHAR